MVGALLPVSFSGPVSAAGGFILFQKAPNILFIPGIDCYYFFGTIIGSLHYIGQVVDKLGYRLMHGTEQLSYQCI